MDCDPIVTSAGAASSPLGRDVFIPADGNRPRPGAGPVPFEGKAVWDVTWVLMAWSILATGLIVWLADAQDLLEGTGGRGRDGTSCVCCRHDRIAHDPDRPDGACTQCPCESYRPLA